MVPMWSLIVTRNTTDAYKTNISGIVCELPKPTARTLRISDKTNERNVGLTRIYRHLGRHDAFGKLDRGVRGFAGVKFKMIHFTNTIW